MTTETLFIWLTLVQIMVPVYHIQSGFARIQSPL